MEGHCLLPPTIYQSLRTDWRTPIPIPVAGMNENSLVHVPNHSLVIAAICGSKRGLRAGRTGIVCKAHRSIELRLR